MKKQENIFKGIEPKDPLMLYMWYGFIKWALGEKEIMDQFRKDTGNTWKPSSIPIEQTVDKSTGVDKDFFKEFARWANKNLWGENYL
jgi:hypothetical protein